MTDPQETAFLLHLQRLSVADQRFNAACLADTFPISESARDHSEHVLFLFTARRYA